MSYFRLFCLSILNLRPYVNESHDHCFIHTYIEWEWVWICDWGNWQVNELICESGSESVWVKVSGVSWWLIWLLDVCLCGCAFLVTTLINQSIGRSIYWLSDRVTNWMWVNVHVGLVYMSEWVIGLVIVNGAGGMEESVGRRGSEWVHCRRICEWVGDWGYDS